MPFDPGDIGRATVNMTMPNGVPAQNVFTAEYGGLVSQPDAFAIIDWTGYLDEIYNVIADDMSDLCTIDNFELAKMIVVLGEPVAEFIGIGLITPQPNNGNQMQAHGSSMLFSSRLSGTGRGSAKKFWPGFTEAGLTEGQWDAGVIANMQVPLASWSSDFGGPPDWTPGTWSVVKGFRQMLLPVVRAFPGYQRRRKPANLV